jgi:1,4-alpha-glucan branching enzyme
MNLLMIGLGDSGLDDPNREPVGRHLEYARRIGGHIDLIVESPSGGVSDYGAFTVHRVGVSRARFPFAAYRLAREAARKHAPHLITTQDPFATALAGIWLRRTLKRPLLIQNHSCFLFNRYWIAERPLMFRALHLLARLLLPHADAWRVVNTRERAIYVERLGLPAERVLVLPVPCDLSEFARARIADLIAAARERLPFASGAPMVFWAGRPVRFKRLPLLFEAFARIRAKFPDAKLVVAGRKELAQEDLDGAARQAGLGESLVWTGELARADLAGMYGAADIFLYPSIYEGFGRVLVEAGAAGLPVAATDTAGAADILADGETGFLVPIEDAGELARRSIELLSDPELYSRMSAAAQERIRTRFDPEKMYSGIVSQWRETAEKGMRP